MNSLKSFQIYVDFNGTNYHIKLFGVEHQIIRKIDFKKCISN